MGENIINKKEYCMAGFEICPKVRRFSRSMKSILKKPSIYKNSFMNVREVKFPIVVKFDENRNPIFKAVLPPEIIEGMKNGTIKYSDNEISAILMEVVRMAQQQIKLKANPTRVWHS